MTMEEAFKILAEPELVDRISGLLEDAGETWDDIVAIIRPDGQWTLYTQGYAYYECPHGEHIHRIIREPVVQGVGVVE